jgi:GNAT superfamily N-acetyltransferase
MPTIRLATESDILRLVELYGDLIITTSPGEVGRTPAAEDYRRAFAHIQAAPGQELLVAEEDGKVIGTMTLIIVPNLTHGGLPWAGVESVMVDAAYRRRGIGKLMMDYALPEARKARCYKIQLISDKFRTEAHRFYESLGYSASGHGFRMYL